jgi:nucleotide-binding universal stress UspA family protein
MLKRFESEGIGVSAMVGRGDPAEVIAQEAEAAEVDLLVLATHGKAGTKAFWSHSVGARVLAQTSRPVLLVPARKAG